MNVLFLGDLVGEASVYYLKKNLGNIMKKYNIGFVMVNGENVLNGYGITGEICDQLFDIGVNVISSGNHIWDQEQIIPYIARKENLLRPLNMSNKSPGNGFVMYQDKYGKKILAVNMICNLFMRKSDDVFISIEHILAKYKLKKNCDAIIIDLHGETASEKQAFANYVDGKVTAVLGTHTHVPTSDFRILPKGSAFHTDTGMCGDYDSVIGGDKNQWVKKFLNKNEKKKINSSSVNYTLCGTLIKVCKKTGLSSTVKQLILGDVIENRIPNEKYFL